jgi:hypothetical protein
MNTLMRAACERLGGRGGGKPDFAQGGGSKLSELDKALEEVRTHIPYSIFHITYVIWNMEYDTPNSEGLHPKIKQKNESLGQ